MALPVPSFSNLPPEIVLKCISLASEDSAKALCQMRAVSRQFRQLVSQVDSVIWGLSSSGLTEAEVLLFLRSAPLVTNLSFLWEPVLSPAPSIGFLTGVFLLAPQLRKLRLYELNFKAASYPDSGCLTKQLFQLISELCPSLHKLEVSLHHAHLFAELEGRRLFPSLRDLHLILLSPDCWLSQAFLESLINPCPVLEAVELSGAAVVTSAHLHSTSLRSLTIEGYKSWFDRLDAPNLAHLKLDLISDTIINAPKLRTLAIGDLHRASDGRLLTECAPWTLQHLKIMGPWEIEHFNSVMGACQEVAALDLELVKIIGLHEHSFMCSHPFAQCVLERLRCVQELLIDSLDTFGQLGWGLVAGPESATPLENLKGLKVFYNHDVDELDFEVCKDLIALSPNLEQLDMLIEADEDFDEELDHFENGLAKLLPHLRVNIDQLCDIGSVKDKWHVEKTGRPHYCEYFSD